MAQWQQTNFGYVYMGNHPAGDDLWVYHDGTGWRVKHDGRDLMGLDRERHPTLEAAQRAALRHLAESYS